MKHELKNDTDMSQEFPDLQPSQYALLQVEVATGIVLTINGEWAVGSAECYLIFNSFNELETFAQERIHSHPAIECVVFDWQQTPIKVFRNNVATYMRRTFQA